MAYKRALASPISVRLPQETKETLEQLAEERHMELSPFLVAIIEDWLKIRKEIGDQAMNWRTYINNSEYKVAMGELIRDTFLDSVIHTPNYRDNIKDVVKKVLSEVLDEGSYPKPPKKKKGQYKEPVHR
jgi:predicted DNA-binding protein